MGPRVAVVFSGQLRGFPSLWHDIRARLIIANSKQQEAGTRSREAVETVLTQT